MAMNFLRQHWKMLLGIVIFTFLSSFIGRMYGHPDIGVAIACLFCAWAFYFLRTRARIAAAINAGNFEEALALSQKELSDHSDDPNLYITACAACIGLSRPAEALQYADQTLSLAPKNARALVLRACARGLMNLLDEALDDCNIAIETCPEYEPTLASALAYRAAIYAAKGDVQKAIDDCNRALRIAPDNHSAYLSRAYANCYARQFPEAMNDLETADNLLPPKAIKAIIMTHKARVSLCLGNTNAALEQAQEAVKDSKTPVTLSTLGLILARQRNFEEALLALNKAIEVDPFNAEAYWFRYELYEAMGDLDKAEKDKEIATNYQYRPYL